MARYANPDLMMIDGGGDIPDLVSALEGLKTAESQAAVTKVNSGIAPLTGPSWAELAAAEEVKQAKAASQAAAQAAAQQAAATQAAAEAEELRKVASKKAARNIALNDAEYEALNTPTPTPAKAAASVNPSALASQESGAIGAASIAAQIKAAEQAAADEVNSGVAPLTGPSWEELSAAADAKAATPKIPTDLATPEAEEYYNRLKGRAGAGVKPTPEEQEFLNNYLIHRGEVLKGTRTAGQELTPAQKAEEDFLANLGVIGSDKPYTGPATVVPTTTSTATTTTTTATATPTTTTTATATPTSTLTPAESAALAAVNAQVTALQEQIAALVTQQTQAATAAAANAAKPTVVGVRTVRKTGGIVETVEVMSDGSLGRVIDSYKDFGARDSVMQMFQNLGLGTDLINSMVASIDKVYDENIMPTEDQVINAIYSSDAYNARFAANKTIRERMASGKGLPGDRVLTPREYIETERTYKQYMEQAGLPVDFYNELNDFTGLIANSISADELKDRINVAKNVLQTADADTKKALKEYYNLTDADMVAYILDKDKAFRAIDSRFVYSTADIQKMYTVSELGGSAKRAGLGEDGIGITKQFAEEIAASGKAGEAESAFQTTARNQEDYARLMGLYGQNATEEDLTRQQLSLAGGAQGAIKTKKLASKERAKFQSRSAIDRASLTRRLNNPDV